MYFEIKVFDLIERKASKSKTKIQLNAGTPFSADLRPEIKKSDFNPKRVRELLHFIADDLILRIVIKENPDNHFRSLFAAQAKITNGKPLSANYSASDRRKLDAIEAKMLQEAKDLIEKRPDLVINLTQFNFDKLSPPLLAQSLQTIVNSNVPPPKTRP
jgi:hypothetical protein